MTLASLLLFCTVTAFAGEIIDGVVAVVNRKPILRSDWAEAVCFEAFMQQKSSAAMGDDDRNKALERLIDRRLLSAEMGDSRYLLPSDAELQERLAALRNQVADNDEAAWQKALSAYGLTEEGLREQLRSEVQIMNFIDARLRPNVSIQPEEVEAYYRTKYAAAQPASSPPAPLPELESDIRELLTQQRMDELLDSWLHNLRQQAEIHSTVPLPALSSELANPRLSGAN